MRRRLREEYEVGKVEVYDLAETVADIISEILGEAVAEAGRSGLIELVSCSVDVRSEVLRAKLGKSFPKETFYFPEDISRLATFLDKKISYLREEDQTVNMGSLQYIGWELPLLGELSYTYPTMSTLLFIWEIESKGNRTLMHIRFDLG